MGFKEVRGGNKLFRRLQGVTTCVTGGYSGLQ